jgi:hypothetical protein
MCLLWVAPVDYLIVVSIIGRISKICSKCKDFITRRRGGTEGKTEDQKNQRDRKGSSNGPFWGTERKNKEEKAYSSLFFFSASPRLRVRILL